MAAIKVYITVHMVKNDHFIGNFLTLRSCGSYMLLRRMAEVPVLNLEEVKVYTQENSHRLSEPIQDGCH